MKGEIKYKIGFSDGEIVSYFREQNNLTVKIKAWNDKNLWVSFSDVVGVKDYGIGDISNFVEGDGNSLFLETVLCRVYDSMPEKPPYHLFRFLDLDGDPCLEIVAVSQIISED